MPTQRTVPQLRGTPLDSASRRRLAELVHRDGDLAVAERTGISRNSIARAAAGFGLRKGTLLLVREALARLDATDHGDDEVRASRGA